MSKPQTKRKLKNKSKTKHKVNPLKPSMREKKRYMAYKIISQKQIKFADKALINKIKDFLGVFNAGKAGLMSVKYNPKTQKGILRIDRKFVDHIRSCFVMIKHINNDKVLIRTLRVSGMVNKAKKEIE